MAPIYGMDYAQVIIKYKGGIVLVKRKFFDEWQIPSYSQTYKDAGEALEADFESFVREEIKKETGLTLRINKMYKERWGNILNEHQHYIYAEGINQETAEKDHCLYKEVGIFRRRIPKDVAKELMNIRLTTFFKSFNELIGVETQKKESQPI